jgi:hypothetical protein
MDDELFDPDDYEQLEEMVNEVADYSLAGHIVRVTTEAEMTGHLASLWQFMRGLSDGLESIAMVLERLAPTKELAEMSAKEIKKYSELIQKIIPAKQETDLD